MKKAIKKKKRFVLKKGLYPLKGKVKTRAIFGFDIETYKKNKGFLCASIVGKNYTFFTRTKEKFIKELTSNRLFENCYICATNLLFDFCGIFSLHYMLNKFSVTERHGSLIYAKTYINKNPNDNNLYSSTTLDYMIASKEIKDKKNFYPITFIDSGNFLKMSVKQLGEIVKLPKYNSPIRLGFKPRNKKEWDYMIK